MGHYTIVSFNHDNLHDLSDEELGKRLRELINDTSTSNFGPIKNIRRSHFISTATVLWTSHADYSPLLHVGHGRNVKTLGFTVDRGPFNREESETIRDLARKNPKFIHKM